MSGGDIAPIHFIFVDGGPIGRAGESIGGARQHDMNAKRGYLVRYGLVPATLVGVAALSVIYPTLAPMDAVALAAILCLLLSRGMHATGAESAAPAHDDLLSSVVAHSNEVICVIDRGTVVRYVDALRGIVKDRDDVVGYAFGINGKMYGAEVYADHALFLQLWPKMLRANAIEAVAEAESFKEGNILAIKSVKRGLKDAAKKEPDDKEVTKRIHLLMRETKRVQFFEVRDRDRKDTWIHRSYEHLLCVHEAKR